MSEQNEPRVPEPQDASEEARVEYGRQLAMDSILQAAGEASGSAEDEIPATVGGGGTTGRSMRRALLAAAAARPHPAGTGEAAHGVGGHPGPGGPARPRAVHVAPGDGPAARLGGRARCRRRGLQRSVWRSVPGPISRWWG